MQKVRKMERDSTSQLMNAKLNEAHAHLERFAEDKVNQMLKELRNGKHEVRAYLSDTVGELDAVRAAAGGNLTKLAYVLSQRKPWVDNRAEAVLRTRMNNIE